MDETYEGDRHQNKPEAVRDRLSLEMGWGGVSGKEPVVGVRDLATGKLAARASLYRGPHLP